LPEYVSNATGTENCPVESVIAKAGPEGPSHSDHEMPTDAPDRGAPALSVTLPENTKNSEAQFALAECAARRRTVSISEFFTVANA